uniref:Uncharacterized protein n=1 Tax=Glossina austeni TaxID=7395 RepID=A0A1A9V1W8_GLOAU
MLKAHGKVFHLNLVEFKNENTLPPSSSSSMLLPTLISNGNHPENLSLLFFPHAWSGDYGRRSMLHKWSLLTQDNRKNQHALVAVSLAVYRFDNKRDSQVDILVERVPAGIILADRFPF